MACGADNSSTTSSTNAGTPPNDAEAGASELGTADAGQGASPVTVLDVTPAVATSALKAKDGTAVADVGTSFTSIFNSNTDITYFNAAGTTVTRHTTWTLDTDGRLARKTTFGPGPDGMLKTIDDVPTWYEQWTYSSNGNRHVSFNGAGADATWFTADESSPRMSTPTHP